MTDLVKIGYVTFNEAYEMTIDELNATIEGKQSIEKREIDRNRLFFGSLISIFISVYSKQGSTIPKWDEIFPDSTKENTVEEQALNLVKIFGGKNV